MSVCVREEPRPTTIPRLASSPARLSAALVEDAVMACACLTRYAVTMAAGTRTSLEAFRSVPVQEGALCWVCEIFPASVPRTSDLGWARIEPEGCFIDPHGTAS